MLEMRQLSLFLALADELHFGRAAARLGIAQPGLSQQIRALEEELGVRLFERTSRVVSLTAAGESLRIHADLILKASQNAALNVKRAVAAERGVLRLAFVGSGAFGVLPDLLRRYHARYPQVRIFFHDDHLHYPFELLEGGLLDLAIVRAPVTYSRLRIESFFSEPLSAVLPTGHKLLARRTISLKDLARERFVFFPRRNAPEFHDAVMSACVASGFSPLIEYEASDWQVIASIVGANLAVTIAPNSTSRMRREGIEYRSIRGLKLRAELAFAYDPKRLTAAASGFLEIARSTRLYTAPRLSHASVGGRQASR